MMKRFFVWFQAAAEDQYLTCANQWRPGYDEALNGAYASAAEAATAAEEMALSEYWVEETE